MATFTQNSDYFDNSAISDYKKCPRSFYFRHVRGWRIQGTSHALIFGLAWHSAMEYVWEHAKEERDTDLAQNAFLRFLATWEESGMNPNPGLDELEVLGARTPMVGMEMLGNYLEQRTNTLRNCTLLANETPFAVPMPGLEDTYYVGRLDKAIAFNGGRLIIEHKTTSEYSIKHNFQPNYVESWDVSPQIKGYQFAGVLQFGDLDAVWIDAALVHKKIHNAFKFIPIAHHSVLLVGWLENTANWIMSIKADMKNLNQNNGKVEKGIFRKNEESCYGRYGPCPFLDICRTTEDPSKLAEVPVGYIHEPWEPFDILQLDQLINKEIPHA